MYSDPMPGENLESKEMKEAEAIANGENFNPNIDDATAEAFENLAETVPFAGENEEPNADSLEPPIVDRTIRQEGEQLVHQQQPEEDKAHDSDNPISKQFNQHWDAGDTPNIDDIKENIDRNYIAGATEQVTSNEAVTADISDAEKDATNTNNLEDNDQPHDIAEAATIEAIGAQAAAEEAIKDINTGKDADINEVIQRADKAEELADKIQSTAEDTATATEAKMANGVAEQVREMAAEAAQSVNEAKAEYDSMSEEEKEATKEAAEAAEINGTTLEEEKAKADDLEDVKQAINL